GVAIDAHGQLAVGALADVVVGEEAHADHRRRVKTDGDPLTVLPAFRAADAAVLGVPLPRRGVGSDGDNDEKEKRNHTTHGRDSTRSAFCTARRSVDRASRRCRDHDGPSNAYVLLRRYTSVGYRA